MNLETKATDNFTGGCNCCQSVLLTFTEEMRINLPIFSHLSSGFGGGMGSMGKTCGAVTGAYMSLGMYSGKRFEDNSDIKKQSKDWIHIFNQKFIEEFGNLDCKALIGYDLSVDSERAKAVEAGVFETQCPKFVAHAVKLVEELIQ